MADSCQDWVNNCCPHGCDCGDCYSRSPDEGACHCAVQAGYVKLAADTDPEMEAARRERRNANIARRS